MTQSRCGIGGVTVRGTDETSGSLFNYVDLEYSIPFKQPLCKFRRIVNATLVGLDAEYKTACLFPAACA